MYDHAGPFSLSLSLSLSLLLSLPFILSLSLGRGCAGSRGQFSGRLCWGVPAGGVAVGVACLCVRSLWGARAQWRPLQRPVGVSGGRAPLVGALGGGWPCPLLLFLLGLPCGTVSGAALGSWYERGFTLLSPPPSLPPSLLLLGHI